MGLEVGARVSAGSGLPVVVRSGTSLSVQLSANASTPNGTPTRNTVCSEVAKPVM